MAKMGGSLLVKFQVRDLISTAVRDESAELRLLQALGNIVAGPFFFAGNPTQGVAILVNKQAVPP